MPEGILSELMSATTNKLKFVVFPFFFATYCAISNSGPETLMASYDYWDGNLKMLPEILNKRWQTLDVKSMMSELQRSSSGFMVQGDTLSSVHRFKRKEGVTSTGDNGFVTEETASEVGHLEDRAGKY